MSTASAAGNGAHSGASGSSKLWSGHGVDGGIGGGEATSYDSTSNASKLDDYNAGRSASSGSYASSRSAAGPSSRVHYRSNDRPEEKDGKR